MGLLGTLERFGKAVWEAGKDAVDVIGDVTAVVEGAQAVGDFISRIGSRADIAKVVEVGEKLAGWAERVGLNRVLRAADSAILDGGQVVIAGMRLTTGVGAPEAGERFGTGSVRFRDAAATLSSAQPTDDWSGEASHAYAGRNSKQKAGADDLASADHAVHRVLATEAYQVNFHRDRLDGWSNWLADVGLVTFGIGLIPGYGKAAKEATELAAVMTAVGSSSLELRALSSEVEANSAELGQLLRTYQGVGRSIDPAGSGPRPPDPPPPTAPPGRPSSTPTPDVPPGQLHPDVPPTPASNPGGSGALGGAGAGAGSGARVGKGPAAASSPTTRPHVPAAPAPSRSQASRGAAPAAMGAAPAGQGPAPAAPSAPSTATPSIPAAVINQAVQSAVQKAVEKALEEADERRDREEEAKKADDGRDGEGEGEDGDGAPDSLATDEQDGREIPPTAAVGATDAGLAPIGPASVSDPVSLDRPVAATLDREKFNRADAGASTIGR